MDLSLLRGNELTSKGGSVDLCWGGEELGYRLVAGGSWLRGRELGTVTKLLHPPSLVSCIAVLGPIGAIFLLPTPPHDLTDPLGPTWLHLQLRELAWLLVSGGWRGLQLH